MLWGRYDYAFAELEVQDKVCRPVIDAVFKQHTCSNRLPKWLRNKGLHLQESEKSITWGRPSTTLER